VLASEHMTMDSKFQVTPSPRPRRERVGLVVDGSNAAAAVKTIVSAEDSGVRQVWMTQSPFWPRHIDHICDDDDENIYNMSWNIDPANIYAQPAGPCSAGAILLRSGP
jgi:hypothetical protein